MKMRLLLLFLSIFVCCILDRYYCLIEKEQQPIFTSQPTDVGPLFPGTRGILQCTASGTPPISYMWLRNGKPLFQKSMPNGSVYIATDLNRYKDPGVYQCIAENKLGSILSNQAHLTVAYMELLKVTYPVEITCVAGRAALIKAPRMVDSYPAPTVEWFAGGALIEPNAKFAITNNYDLVVLRCDKADEKMYRAEFSNIHNGDREASREIHLSVLDSNKIAFDPYADFDYQSKSAIDESTDDLEFVVRPNDTIAKLNDNLVKFDCIVNSKLHPLDQIEITWYKDDLPIDFVKSKYHLSSRTLEIFSVTDQDAGVYKCSARYSVMGSAGIGVGSNSNSQSMAINASAKLDVYIKPTFKIQPESVIETDLYNTVQLKCEGISNPPANITWYKNAQLIDFEKNPNFQLHDSMTKLVINNIKQEDQAIYQCFLSNQAGQISASTLIKIISIAPNFTQQILNRTVYSDSNIELSCGKVDGSPKPKITWSRISYENNQEAKSEMIDDLDRYQERSFGTNSNGELQIKSVNMKHQGWYKCEASNTLGKVDAKMYLQVKKKTEIIEPPMNISVTKGQSALFKCTVSKEDEVEVDLRWKFNDLDLDLTPISESGEQRYSNNHDSSNLKLYKNGTLQILEAKNTDIGTYRCEVSSLNNLEAGWDSKTAFLNVVELPYAPINLNAVLIGEKRSANLSWQPSFDGNSAILKYIVQARINSFDQSLLQYDQSSSLYDWFVIKDNVLTLYDQQQQLFQRDFIFDMDKPKQITHWTLINELKPAFTYEFRVSAVNGIGEGMPSRPSNNVTIPEEIPSMPPQNIQAYSTNSKTIFIQWQPPPVTSWNGRLRGYQIAYSLSYPNSTWKYTTIDDYVQTTANLTDLIVWETYLIKICALNSKGHGKYNHPPIRIRTKEGIPIRAPNSFKANSVNSTCIKMSWSEPPAQFVNGIIQGYKLIFYENNQTDVRQTHAIYTNQSLFSSNLQNSGNSQGDNQYHYQMCNLAKFTLYTLSILCFTSSGDGPLTQPIQLKTLADVPGEVSDIIFNNVYDTSVDLEWKPPIQPNGRILSYVISYRPLLSNSTKFSQIIVDSSQTTFTLHNLKSSTEYLIGIRAKTQAGDGIQKILQIKSGVPPELPEPPRAIVVRSIGRTSVELEFIPGYNGKTSINKWIVEALIVFNAEFNTSKWYVVYEKSNAPNATKLTVDNLKPFTNYTLRMFAKNVKGMSAASQSTEVFQTLADVPSATSTYLSARLKSPYINTTRSNNINILIKWSPIPSSKWNGIPLGYVLFVSDCDQPSISSTSNATKSAPTRIEIKYSKYRSTSYLMRSLAAHKCYRFNIAAWNNVGLGSLRHEDLVLNRTSQSKPSNYTYNVNLYTINSTAIRVTWSKLDQAYANGLLTGYLIRYQPVHNIIQKADINDSVINYYDYSEPNNEENGDNDLIYMSNYKPKEMFYRITLQNDPDFYYETTLSNLLSHCTYKVEISTCTRAGCGQFSLPVSIRTTESLPSRPIDLHFPYVNSTSVSLEWSPPRYPNGLLSAYRIRFCLKPQFAHSKPMWQNLYLTVNQTNFKNRIDISGLVKMEYYIFEVSANNSAGKGWGEAARSIVYTIETLTRKIPDRPSRPSISKSSIKTNELTISWTTNSDNYSPIRYFLIQFREEVFNSTTEWKSIYFYKCANSNLNNNYRLTIKGLNKQNEPIIKPNGHMYKFRLAATNDIGTSDFSDESNIIKSKYDLPQLNLYNLTARVIDLKRVMLKWEEILLDDDSLIKFKIIYRKISPNVEESAFSQGQGSEELIDYKSTRSTKRQTDESHVIHEYELPLTTSLEANGVYEFEICGINVIGQSPKCTQSGSIVYMEDRRPRFNQTHIRSVRALSSTEINVTWSQPSDAQINGKLLGYRVVYVNNDYLQSGKVRRMLTKNESSSEFNFYPDESLPQTISESDLTQLVDVLIVEPNITNIVLSNLKPFKNYSVFVQLLNEGGESELATNELETSNMAQTFEATPSQPRRIEFSYISYTFLNVTFYRPVEPNGILKAYELWYENVPSKPHLSQTTKIIRQEILNNLDAENQTLYITNLEPMSTYKFKVRCRTSIDWGPYLERIVYTGPQLRKNYAKLIPNLESMSSESVIRDSAPLSPSKPIYNPLNDSHALLEWKSYSLDYELFIIEIKIINLMEAASVISTPSLYTSNSTPSTTVKRVTSSPPSTEFEIFAYSNTTNLLIDKYDKQLSALLVAKIPQTQGGLSTSAANLLCVFRVLSFGRLGISEPSAVSDLVSVSKLTSPSLLMSSISKELSSSSSQFYLNWWFLVIIALASCTFLIIIVLIMLLRGKNKKFLMKKQKLLQQQQREQQQKMNTIKMMKITAPNSSDGSSPEDTDEANMNTNSIYLAGSNQQLILTNATNSLSRTVGPTYASTLNPGMPLSSQQGHITVYELRKSKRLASGGSAAAANGTIRTATYVSPNGTLGRINFIMDNTVAGEAGTSSQFDLVELKQSQISGVQNPRNLSQLVGLGTATHSAQPNDYCTSGKIGALILDDNATIKSGMSSSNRNGHYLIPQSSNRAQCGEEVGGESLSEQQHLYFQHMAQNTYVPNTAGHVNANFNYSSSDTENDSNGHANHNAFNHMAAFNMSKRQIYTTNSFGRQQAVQKAATNNIDVPANLPPPPPSLLTSSVINPEPDMNHHHHPHHISSTPQAPIQHQMTYSEFDGRRPQITKGENTYQFASSRNPPNRPVNANTYYEHQQLRQQQPMYYSHQSPVLLNKVNHDQPPPPPPPPPPLPQQLIQASQYRQSLKSPFIQKKPIQVANNSGNSIQTPQLKSIANNSNQEASSEQKINTASMRLKRNNVINLNSAHSDNACNKQQQEIELNPAPPVPNRQIAAENEQTSAANNASSISINLSGDRVVMNNVAGSRRPLTGGFSMF